MPSAARLFSRAIDVAEARSVITARRITKNATMTQPIAAARAPQAETTPPSKNDHAGYANGYATCAEAIDMVGSEKRAGQKDCPKQHACAYDYESLRAKSAMGEIQSPRYGKGSANTYVRV